MPRPVRLQSEDCFYHITSRGDDRKPIFRSERDYQKFLEYLALGREKYKYYINKAGGYTDNARTGDVMIIKRATRQWISPADAEIEEGDCVWVPKVPERSSIYYWTLIGQMASIISVAVSIVILTVQLKK